MNTANDLMADVTQAVFKAERALDETISAYEALRVAEQRVLDSTDPDVTEEDKAISARSVENCTNILAILRVYLAVDDPGNAPGDQADDSPTENAQQQDVGEPFPK
jgi:hypothetical protein